MDVYAAFYGEYEESYPIGVYDTLTKAKEAVLTSKPTCNTEVIMYDTTTGKPTTTYYYFVHDGTWGIWPKD